MIQASHSESGYLTRRNIWLFIISYLSKLFIRIRIYMYLQTLLLPLFQAKSVSFVSLIKEMHVVHLGLIRSLIICNYLQHIINSFKNHSPWPWKPGQSREFYGEYVEKAN